MLSAAELQRRLDARQSMASIAEELGITREAVVYRIRTLGLKRPPPVKAIKLGKRPPPMPSVVHSKPVSGRRTTRRQCITCGENFTSHGPGNRMCTACRHATEVTIYSIGASKK